MRGIILYQTEYGSTEQYALWLSEDTGLPVSAISKFDASSLSTYDFVVVGSAVKMGNLLASGWIKKNWEKLRTKKLLLFAVAGMAHDEPETLKQLEESLTPSILRAFTVHPLPGRLLPYSLGIIDRFIVWMVQRNTENPELKKRLTRGFDEVDHVHLAELSQLVNRMRRIPAA